MSDLIDRQAAIEAVDGVSFMTVEAKKLGVHESMDGTWLKADEVEEAIKSLPSAQPDADLIHLQKEQAYMQGWEDAMASIRCKDGG